MAYEKFIEVHEVKYFKKDIEKMDKLQIKTLCSLVDKEGELLFIQQCCNEDYQYLVDNVMQKLPF